MVVILTCAYCGGSLASGDRYCPQCGAELRSCPNCGESLLPGDLFCPECGTPAEAVELPPSLSDPSIESQAVLTDLIERLQRATLGEFEIGPELGRGGMAAVFLAHEIALDRKVAIKVMSPGTVLGDGIIDRFRNEAVTVASLHHPNIVPLYSVRHAEGLHFFVMRYVQGRSLEQVIQHGGRLPLPIVRSILYQVGSALAYAHRSRVIHRDIKPANILIDQDGNAVVTDFGIAKAAESPIRTLTGALVGTPAYMSPEQCSGTGVSWASDQYALGAVAYEMLTGVPPFSGSTLTVMQAHVESVPRPIREHAPDCPPELEAAVFHMLAKDPADRWPRMSEAMAALGAVPLADDDPLRTELCRIVNASAGPSPAKASTPTSPRPATQPSQAPEEIAGSPVGVISILPPPAGLEVGDSFVLVAMVRGQHGTRLPPTDVTWSSSGPELLRFESSGGVAVALAAGSTLLTATCRAAQAHLRVEVASPRADEIAIGPLDHPVGVGDEIRLEASARDKRGRPIARPVIWRSDDSATATVTPDGAVVALAPGFARITALLDDARASIVIPVLPARVAAIQIADWPTSVAVTRSFVVSATPVDSWDNPLAGRTVTWRANDASIAEVSATGRVTPLRPGSVVLTATCDDVSASIRVEVYRSLPAGAESKPVDPVVSQQRTGRRRRSRRSRRIRVLAAAIVVALISGAIWRLTRSPDAAGVSVNSSSTAPPAAEEPPGYAESSFGADSAAPAAPAPVRPKRSRAVGPSPESASIAPDSPSPARDTGEPPAALPEESVAPVGAELVRLNSLPPAPRATTRQSSKPPAAPPVERQLRAGAGECYAVLRAKNVARVTALYSPANKSDAEKLRKLSRILRTREWSAVVGEQVEGSRKIGPTSASMEFSFRLSWKDAFGGHLTSEPVFRAEFARQGDRWNMSSCRIVGSPKL
jgi:eukaryotic-like serine/threonine-protein kinase